MKMSRRLDAGEIILSKKVSIDDEDNALTLTEKLSEIGAGALMEAIGMIKDNKAVYHVQDEGQATYAPMLSKDTGHINWRRSTTDILNLVRGTYPWPGAYFYANGRMIKVTGCFAEQNIKGNPSEVLRTDRDGIQVGCVDGSVVITSLQPEGKRPMTADEYLRGNKLEKGTVLE